MLVNLYKTLTAAPDGASFSSCVVRVSIYGGNDPVRLYNVDGVLMSKDGYTTVGDDGLLSVWVPDNQTYNVQLINKANKIPYYKLINYDPWTEQAPPPEPETPEEPDGAGAGSAPAPSPAPAPVDPNSPDGGTVDGSPAPAPSPAPSPAPAPTPAPPVTTTVTVTMLSATAPVVASCSAEDAAKISSGDSIVITRDAPNAPVSGTISNVTPSGFTIDNTDLSASGPAPIPVSIVATVTKAST